MAYILTLICLTTKFEKKIVEKNNQEIAWKEWKYKNGKYSLIRWANN